MISRSFLDAIGAVLAVAVFCTVCYLGFEGAKVVFTGPHVAAAQRLPPVSDPYMHHVVCDGGRGVYLPPPGVMYNVAIGLHSLESVVNTSHILAIGDNTGKSLVTGHHVILIGDGIDVPSPNTSYYVNIGGKVLSWDEGMKLFGCS